MSVADDSAAEILDRLFDVIERRRRERPEGSYVVRLLDGGQSAIAAKIREEANEVVDALREESDEAIAAEVADLVFHVFVGLAEREVPPSAVYAELARRFGIGGLVEKAARTSETNSRTKDSDR